MPNKFRQSHISTYEMCEEAFRLAAIVGVESKPNAAMLHGTKQHNRIDKQMKDKVIPDDIKPFFDHIGIDFRSWKSEVSFQEQYNDDIVITGIVDAHAVLKKEEKLIAVDWKFPMSEFSVDNFYTTKTTQLYIYAWLGMMRYNLKHADMYYYCPEFNDMIEFNFTLHEVMLEVDRIMGNIHLSVTNNDFHPNFNYCSMCLYKDGCRYINTLLDNSIQVYRPRSLVTQDQIDTAWQIKLAAETIAKQIDAKAKELLKDGTFDHIELPNGDRVVLKECKGRKKLMKGKTYKGMLAEAGIDVEEYMEQGNPYHMMRTIKAKAVKE